MCREVWSAEFWCLVKWAGLRTDLGGVSQMDRLGSAAQMLHTYLAAVHGPVERPDVSAMTHLMYHVDLTRPAVDLDAGDGSVDADCLRVGDVMHGHLMLESLLISMTAKATGRTPEQILARVMAEEQSAGQTP